MMIDQIVTWLIEPLIELKNRSATISLLVWGLMFSYFPTYAYIHGWVAWVFYFVGLICSFSVIASAVDTIRKKFNDRFFSSVVRVLLLAALVAGTHFLGTQIDIQYGDGQGLYFKLSALAYTAIALPSIIVCCECFYVSEEKKKLLLETFTFKNIVAFVSATVAFLTILIPFIQLILQSTTAVCRIIEPPTSARICPSQ